MKHLILFWLIPAVAALSAGILAPLFVWPVVRSLPFYGKLSAKRLHLFALDIKLAVQFFRSVRRHGVVTALNVLRSAI